MPQVLTQLLVDAVPNMRVSYVVIIGLVGGVGGACLGVSHTEETVRLVGGYAGFYHKVNEGCYTFARSRGVDVDLYNVLCGSTRTCGICGYKVC